MVMLANLANLKNDGFQNILHPCGSYENSLSIGRFKNEWVEYGASVK